ncbi:uncharacterized protein LOC128558837 [Mercenaria mercenaria]|uniref:uncharacterized protein LOC128558837 n=1 Tax=Mercenaria mercenaria TaxID=6596 RepID=UPI00234F707A|nr:uncharacterized protein LOC128558837 [Mercenaria mercenaria]
MHYEMFAIVVFAVFCGIHVSHGSSSPKYTWPLFTGNPVLEIKQDVAEGKQGCFIKSGSVHSTLDYSGIYLTGSAHSYVDVNIDDSAEFKDFSFTVYAWIENVMGAGTIFHYKQTGTGGEDTVAQDIKDVIFWNNQTHLAAETYGPNNELYSSTTAEFNISTMVQQWVGLRFSHSHNQQVKLVTNTGVYIKMETMHHTHLGQPGTLRFGSSFNASRPSFYGNLICSNMYDTFDGSLSDSLKECAAGVWQQNTAGATPTETCDDLKGYLEIKQRNASIDASITALDYMATMSRVKCAEFCLRTELCWTFTLDKGLGVCKIYDADYSSNILSTIGCNYYIRRDVCC